MPEKTGRVVTSLLLFIALSAGPGASVASGQSLSRVSLDSVGALDLFKGNGTTGNPDASVDISAVIRLSAGWSVQVRPWFYKSSSKNSEWSRELYQAAARYERPGPVALRVDAGFIASPIGLGMLDMRADTNPTIQGHLSYFVPLLSFDRAAPPQNAITASYPIGANVTVSTSRWDARAAVVNSAPTRRYAFNADYGNPDATPVLIAGGGITPTPGLRIGASFAAGRYATAAEVHDPGGNGRNLRMWTAEGEYAFAYTRIAAEFTRERFLHGVASDTSSTWFAQVTQTLSPRWFVAGRRETIGSPPLLGAATGSPHLSFTVTDATVGYRLTPAFTLRTSLTSSRWFLAHTADHRVGVQVVWSRRWW